jgi:hypothetical protein
MKIIMHVSLWLKILKIRKGLDIYKSDSTGFAINLKMEYSLADLFTKGLNGPQLRLITQKLGLVNASMKQGENEGEDTH